MEINTSRLKLLNPYLNTKHGPDIQDDSAMQEREEFVDAIGSENE